MPKYIALLRGINVSGQKIIKMDALRTSLAKLDYGHIQAYIQSGNVIFESVCMDQVQLQDEIHQNILDTFGFDVPVLVRSQQEWKQAFENNPFINERQEAIEKCYVTLLSQEPDEGNMEALKSFHKGPEEFIKEGLNLYLLYPNGAGRSKLDHNAIERKLKVAATTRNWKTMTKLMQMVIG
ncbi:DUF1697 domain-containing protein [Reichenbachiella carrageenanivorans]|uniref:DUF1697 domain-containing protein n=1 Tax=Reichenbachiella carrageenanivorans TaxID=2979869 RepID=A0ABY6D4W2_9BACT|nr:DUF1697 domain-containing protein [Reichenbachiella carrageenanivorans]UXX81187.1 DUF1697 domain-containing protein [Reichenbachiella carrageenanivorans]